MTEEQYAEYIMALKDETPVKGYKEIAEGRHGVPHTDAEKRESVRTAKQVEERRADCLFDGICAFFVRYRQNFNKFLCFPSSFFRKTLDRSVKMCYNKRRKRIDRGFCFTSRIYFFVGYMGARVSFSPESFCRDFRPDGKAEREE